ncbi:DUF1491 family protein [Erythrobacter sp. YT30]|uniref:DUF1491 family protein n=1 Tax=Erythrobacter sp. YT30 TaxID=1735012 RepID=UPI00076DBC03|nr:DUF1491 family protein [Erythrobacter sp. YT30]KWV91423.1 hypothetical protein AUC45_09160 [Erythrobacter sp. YT30]
MTGDTRLPAHLEIGAMIKLAEAQGGIATVLSKGERDAGTILLVTISRGSGGQLFERMPQLDGSRAFVPTKSQDIEKPYDFSEYLDRRRRQDIDIWVLEVDIDDPERFVAELPV